jgi:hypothetical protein
MTPARSLALAALVLGTSAVAHAQPPRPPAPDETDLGPAVYVGDTIIKNYDPTPALVTKVTHVPRPKFPVTDIHAHWSLQLDAATLLAAMDDLGVERAVNLSGGFGPQLDRMLETFHAAAPGRLVIFANLDMRQVDDPQFPSFDEVLRQHDAVIARHPKTTFISAHMGSQAEDLEALSGRLARLPNLVVDLSGRVAELGRQPYAARRFLLRWQDRVLFGTDRYPGRPDQPRNRIYYRFLETDDEYFKYYDHPFPPTGEWRIYGVHLPDEVLRKIYQTNADRVLGRSVR